MMYMLAIRPGRAGGWTRAWRRPGPRVLENSGEYESRAELSLRRGLPHGAVSDNSPLNARAGRSRQGVERALRVSQDHPLATTPSSSSTSRSNTATSCRSTAAARARTGRTGRLVGPGNGALAATPTKRWPTARSCWPWPTGSARRSSTTPDADLRRLAELHALRRAHLGRLLLDQRAGERVHQGPVEDQGPVRPRCRPAGAKRCWTRGQAPGLAGADRRPGPGRLQSGELAADRRRAGRLCREGTGVVEPDVPRLRRRPRHVRPGQGRAGLRISRAEAWAAGAKAGRRGAPKGTSIESRFYRVEFDPASGGIASIRDKELDRELVDRARRRTG